MKTVIFTDFGKKASGFITEVEHGDQTRQFLAAKDLGLKAA